MSPSCLKRLIALSERLWYPLGDHQNVPPAVYSSMCQHLEPFGGIVENVIARL